MVEISVATILDRVEDFEYAYPSSSNAMEYPNRIDAADPERYNKAIVRGIGDKAYFFWSGTDIEEWNNRILRVKKDDYVFSITCDIRGIPFPKEEGGQMTSTYREASECSTEQHLEIARKFLLRLN